MVVVVVVEPVEVLDVLVVVVVVVLPPFVVVELLTVEVTVGCAAGEVFEVQTTVPLTVPQDLPCKIHSCSGVGLGTSDEVFALQEVPSNL